MVEPVRGFSSRTVRRAVLVFFSLSSPAGWALRGWDPFSVQRGGVNLLALVFLFAESLTIRFRGTAITGETFFAGQDPSRLATIPQGSRQPAKPGRTVA